MSPLSADPIACGLLLLAAFTLAGAAQTAWFAAPASRAFAWPLDGGASFRGRRIFGANKTTRGLVVMVPAATAAFVLMGGSALLGAIAGAGFMAGELPNSFVKRQLDIAPGAAPAGSLAIAVQFLFDRLDSGIGMLLALSLVVPVAWQTWAVVLIVGPFIHWSFSLVMFRLGLKARAA